jgi:hypothetical protein
MIGGQEGDDGQDDDFNDDPDFNLKLEVLSEQEVMKTMFETYKEQFDSKLAISSKQILSGTKIEWEGILSQIISSQHKRNRSIVKEIIDTCQGFRTELRDKFEGLRDELEIE